MKWVEIRMLFLRDKHMAVPEADLRLTYEQYTSLYID